MRLQSFNILPIFVFRVLTVVLILISMANAQTCKILLNKTVLDAVKYPNARCLDGTQGAYYSATGFGSGINSYIIAFEGGGECADKQSCEERSTTAFGSSSSYPATMAGYYTHGCQANNPFRSWNRIYIRYCSSDIHLGQRTTKSEETWNLYFSGHHIINAVLDDLFSTTDIHKAENIIIAGYSAGATGGVVASGDHIMDKIYKYIHTKSALSIHTTERLIDGIIYKGPKVGLLPTAGFHIPTDPAYSKKNDNDPNPVSYLPWKWSDHKDHVKLYNAFLPTRCINNSVTPQTPEHYCILATHSFQTIITPTFFVQSVIDGTVLWGHGGLPTVWKNSPPQCIDDESICPSGVKDYMKQWQTQITSAMRQIKNHNRNILVDLYPNKQKPTILSGGFMTACNYHTEFYGDAKDVPFINDLHVFQAITRWWNDSTDYNKTEYPLYNPHYHIDSCSETELFCGKCSGNTEQSGLGPDPAGPTDDDREKEEDTQGGGDGGDDDDDSSANGGNNNIIFFFAIVFLLMV